jgi:hypothetical protein
VRIIAFDPGEATGWAIGTLYDDDTPKQLCIEAFGHDPWKKVSLEYDRAMRGDNPFDVVVYESWRLRRNKAKELIGSDMQPSQGIGIIKLGAWVSGARLITSEPMYKDVIDSMMGGTEYLPKRDGVEHERDAVRHLCWAAVTKFNVAPEDIYYQGDR